MSELNDNKFEVYNDRTTYMLIFLVNVVLVLFASFLIFEANSLAKFCSVKYCSDDPYFYWIIGWVIIVLFGFLGLPLSIFGALHPKKVFSADENGFSYNNYGYINWNDLASVDYCSKTSSINFVVKNSDALSDKLPLHIKLFSKIFNKKIDKFSTSFIGTSASCKEIYDYVMSKIENQN